MKTPKDRYDDAVVIVGKLTTDDVKPKAMMTVLHALEVAAGPDAEKVGYMIIPGIFPDDTGKTVGQGCHHPKIKIPEKSRQRILWYMSPEDAEYLWACMPKWIKEVPGPKHAYDPMYFGTLSRGGDLKVHNEVKRILNR